MGVKITVTTERFEQDKMEKVPSLLLALQKTPTLSVGDGWSSTAQISLLERT